MKESPFTSLPDDVVLNILFKLEDDPRTWSRLACVNSRLSSLVRTSCWPSRCLSTVPSASSDLSDFPSLHKLSVCCPGLRHSGLLLDNSDFGLTRELGPDHLYHNNGNGNGSGNVKEEELAVVDSGSSDLPQWSLYDDLYFDTMYDNSESHDCAPPPPPPLPPLPSDVNAEDPDVAEAEEEEDSSKRRRLWRSSKSHLASGGWGLSREQGNKLLASRFREDTLYISDWPGCIHMEEKRNYMLFRGVFKNFKRSRVWRTINDGGRRNRIDLDCAYCGCKETWDMHSAFCLRRVFGYHDDGEPVVRAYVCENGHVSGAWTDLPLYT